MTCLPLGPWGETSSNTSETLRNPSNNVIQPSLESVKPDIQLVPSLKNLVDTGKLSMEDALEIDGVARQNNWSDDTIKQFYKNAVEGLGVQNKGTQRIESLLVAAKIKAAVYKQNAEQYKQEIETNEKLIKTLYDRLNIKIEGGAPDKYETIANDFIKNLGDLKKTQTRRNHREGAKGICPEPQSPRYRYGRQDTHHRSRTDHQ